MSREILFQAKRTDNGEWVEGCLLIDYITGQYFIHQYGNSINESAKIGEEGCLRFLAFEVNPETLCQYTGFSDEDKNKIFEGAIVGFLDLTSTESGYSEQSCIGKVFWNEETASFQVTGRLSAESYEVLDRGCRVLGNIFDNPELLEQEG